MPVVLFATGLTENGGSEARSKSLAYRKYTVTDPPRQAEIF